MVRSKGCVISVKVPVKWDAMTQNDRTRLSRITSRDSRVIRAFLGVIAHHEKELLVGKRKKKIDGGKLEKLTITAERFNDPTKKRLIVPHDFKKRFPNISVNELQECRQVAVAMWQSYLALGGNHPLKARGYRPRKLPRYIYTRRFKLLYTPDKEVKHWIKLMDSLDSARENRRLHDKLMIPLNPSSYHLNKIKQGTVTSIRLLKDTWKKWWVIFAVRMDTPTIDSTSKPPAVLGIDLGINKAVCSVLLTKTKLRHVRYFTQPEKVKKIQRYDEMIDSLQHERDTRRNIEKPADDVVSKLRELSGKRKNISIDYDRVIVKQLTEHILTLSEKYDVYVAIGKLTGIRNHAGRGSGKSKSFRSKMARWTFARFSNDLKHSLAQNGWKVSGKDSRFIAIREWWTSKTCHKCGNIGMRPKQSLFICHTCGYRTNADKNGAVNIARRLIMLIPHLRDENQGLGRWLLPHEKKGLTLKAWRSARRSKGKSSPPPKLSASRRQSAAECSMQTTLEPFLSTTDPAVGKTVEKPSAASGVRKASDSPSITEQRTEAQSKPKNLDKARVHALGGVPGLAGDSSREKGETRKLKALGGFRSPFGA
jgi:IS605 OrfB family transposase